MTHKPPGRTNKDYVLLIVKLCIINIYVTMNLYIRDVFCPSVFLTSIYLIKSTSSLL